MPLTDSSLANFYLKAPQATLEAARGKIQNIQSSAEAKATCIVENVQMKFPDGNAELLHALTGIAINIALLRVVCDGRAGTGIQVDGALQGVEHQIKSVVALVHRHWS